jgi:predicted nucleic acid-binding protein
MLDFSIQAQLSLLEWIKRGGLHLINLTEEDIQTIIYYTSKYADVPMDLADASLVVAGEKIRTDEIVSINADFYIYRNIRNKYLKNVFFEIV